MPTLSRLLPLALLPLTLEACSDSSSNGGDSTNPPIADTTDPSDAGGTPDGLETSDTSAPRETAEPLDVTSDSPDGGHTAITATPGLKCRLEERVGFIRLQVVEGIREESFLSVGAVLEDRPHPWYRAPALENDTCAFHSFDPTACEPCEADELCDAGGSCVPAPRLYPDARLTLRAGGAQQSFEYVSGFGGIGGSVTIYGPAYGLTVTFSGVQVDVPEAPIPGPVEGAAVTLEGTLEAPTRLTVTWDAPPDEGTHVVTNIPINHHAAGPTFTECAVPAERARLDVGEAMIAPLAIITGLEFQGIEHVRFAAAETPLGCVEVRYLRHQYVSQGP